MGSVRPETAYPCALHICGRPQGSEEILPNRHNLEHADGLGSHFHRPGWKGLLLEAGSSSRKRSGKPFPASAHLHPFLLGIIIASILAAIMSTADSQLLVASSGVVRDIYQKIAAKGKSISQRKLVFLSRLVVLCLVIAAVVFGAVAREYVFWLVLFAWGGLGASFGPPLLLALFWRRMSKAGAAAGLVSGTAITIIWNQVSFLKNIIYELVPAFVFSTLLTILVSLFTSPPEDAEKELKQISAKDRR